MFGRISQRAITQLEVAVAMPSALVSRESGEEQQIAIAASVQQILYASAMVSKFLWPIVKGDFPTARGARLRELLGFVFNGWTIGSAATIETFGTDNSSPITRVIDRDNLVIRHLGRDRAVPEYTGGQASVIDLKAQNAALQDLCRTAAKILDEGA